MLAGGVAPSCPAAAGASLCVSSAAVPALCPLSCGECTCTKNCPPEEDKNLLCDEKEMRDNLAAFLSACDGARDCSGQCKEAFETKYAGCVRGYVPMLVEGHFRNATLKSALDKCAPNDRSKTISFRAEALLDTFQIWAPLQVAALSFAIDVASQDPQLFKGFKLEVDYDVWQAGTQGNSPDDEGEEGVDAAANIFRRGTKNTNVILGMSNEAPILLASRAFSKLGHVNVYYTTGVNIASPLNKVIYPYSVGALASGMKILVIFGPILKRFNWTEMNLYQEEADTVFTVLVPVLQKAGGITNVERYSTFKPGIVSIAPKREMLRRSRRNGVRTYGTAEQAPESLHELALAIYDEKMYGAGWMWMSNIVVPPNIASGSPDGKCANATTCRENDAWEAMQGFIYLDVLQPSEYVLADSFHQRLKPYLSNLTASFSATAIDKKRDADYPDRLAKAKKYLLSEEPGEPPARADRIYYHTQQLYDAFMAFANAADAILKSDPTTAPSAIKGSKLYDTMLKTRFVGSQGKFVLDGYGLKDGHFLMRNVWGKESVKVLLIDSWAKKAFDLKNPDLMVTNLAGNVTWKFQGDPVLFMGNVSETPINKIVGHCAAGTFYTPDADTTKTACSSCPAGFYIERNDASG